MTLHILAISGSLRAGASNTTLLQAAVRLAPAGMRIEMHPPIDVLPHFNPDLEDPAANALPAAVGELRGKVGRADAILLSTPEYAHGLPGSFKNALDWLVGSLEFPGKPVAVISPTSRSIHAQSQLREILTTMSARLIGQVPIVIPVPRRDLDVEAIIGDEQLAAAVRDTLGRLAGEIETPPSVRGG